MGTPITLEVLARILAWSLVFNFGLMILWAGFVKFAPDLMRRSQRMYFPKLDDQQIDLVIYGYMAGFKALVIVFNLVPYLALRIVLS